MEVSSTGSTTASLDAMKKATQVQEQAIVKVLDGAQEQSKKIEATVQQQNVQTAQKTGMGKSLDLMS